MTIRSLFIDVGKTLLDEHPSRFEIYAAEARGVGRDVSAQEMAAMMLAAHDELPLSIDGAYRYEDRWFAAFIERVFGAGLGLARGPVEEIARRLFVRFADPRTYVVFPGARELLREARSRGLVVGAISNWSPRLFRLLAELGLAEEFDFILCSAHERLEKPAAELFRRALARAGTAPGEALHAGNDLRKDYDGARAAGLEAVLVDHFGAHPDFPRDQRVETLFELGARVRERLSSAAPRCTGGTEA